MRPWSPATRMWIAAAKLSFLLPATFVVCTALAGQSGDEAVGSLGLNVRYGKRAVLRPEVRWDWQNRDDPSALPAFRDGRSNHQFLFATDLVVVF